jgi:DsbC/DsbD-like thiol-disulfide interchange protein
MSHRCFVRLARHVLAGAAWLLLPTLFLPTPLLPATSVAENVADEHVKVELVSEDEAIVPHHQLWVGIRFDLQEGWHTYWINPGDSGEPPRIEWTLPQGFEADSIQWPYPTRLSTPPFVDYGYQHQVLLPVVIRTPSGLTVGETEKIIANVHYLICREVCIPGKKQLVLALPVKDHGTPSSNAVLFESTQRQLPKPIPVGWKITAISAGDELRLRLRAGKVVASAQFFPLESEQIENAAPQNVSATRGGLELRLKKSNHLLKALSHIKGVIVVAGTAYAIDVAVSESGQGSMQSKKN